MGLFDLDFGRLIANTLIGCMLPLMDFNDDLYKYYFRIIYPKWLCLKQFVSYHIMTKRAYRHIQQERKRLTIGVMIRN